MNDAPDAGETEATRSRRHLADGQWAPSRAADRRPDERADRPPEALPWYARVLRASRPTRSDDAARRRTR